MISIDLGNGETFELDKTNLPRGSEFNTLVEILEEYNVPARQQHSIAMLYYSQGLEQEFVEVLESLVESSVFNEKEQALTAALLNSYLIKNNQKPNFRGELEINNLLMGVVSLRQQDYRKAEYFFKRCKFSLGLQALAFLENKSFGFRNEALRTLSEYKRGKSSDISTGPELKDCVRYRVDRRYREEVSITEEDVERWLSGDECIEAGGDGLEGKCAEDSKRVRKKALLRNTDVMLAIAEDLLDKDWEKALRILTKVPDNGEKLFLRGKIEHLNGNYDDALVYYKKSTTALSKYNRDRIEQKELNNTGFRTDEAENFQAYLSSKLGAKPSTDCEVNDFLKAKNSPSIYSYRKLLRNRYVPSFVVLNNLAFYMWLELEKLDVLSKDFKLLDTKGLEPSKEEAGQKVQVQKSISGSKDRRNNNPIVSRMSPTPDAMDLRYVRSLREMKLDFVTFGDEIKQQRCHVTRILELALEQAPEEFKETIKQNIVLVNDRTLKVAFEQKNAEGVKDTEDMDLIGYFHLFNKSFDTAKKLLKNDSLALGFIYLEYYFKEKNEKFIEKAVSFFRKSSSIYAINGVALGLIHRGMLVEAKKVLKKLVAELPLANVNLGNLYILESQYKKAVLCYRKVALSNYTFMILKSLSILEHDLQLMKDLLRAKKDQELADRLVKLEERGRKAHDESWHTKIDHSTPVDKKEEHLKKRLRKKEP